MWLLFEAAHGAYKLLLCHKLDNSKCSGSHYVAVVVSRNSVWYFDSIGLPPGMSMNSNIHKRLQKLEKIYYGVKYQSKA